VEAQNRTLNASGDLRYLDPSETRELLRQAINDQSQSVNLRIRYRPTTYEVVKGDTGYRIARKTGLPYNLIEKANEGRDLNRLSIGDVISLPSRDLTLPVNPVPHKRIVVNLDAQSLVAFENGQPVFNWLISSGLSDYPTYPGIFEILDHSEVALGSSYTLCSSSANCGQWEMYWFMGVYEVVPGLMNGFHGAVLLPNGAYLGGGNVGAPYTFGCIMSQNDNAKLLYDWADQGTIVEIISSEYAPQSQLGQLALAQFSTPS
jgi:LysM repeat protein